MAAKNDKTKKPVDMPTDAEGRKKALEAALAQIEKQYGLAASAYACDDLYLAVPHTVNQSVHIGIAFNHISPRT